MEITLNKDDYEKLISGEAKYILHTNPFGTDCDICVEDCFKAVIRLGVVVKIFNGFEINKFTFNFPSIKTIELDEIISENKFHDDVACMKIKKILVIREREEKDSIIAYFEEILLGE